MVKYPIKTVMIGFLRIELVLTVTIFLGVIYCFVPLFVFLETYFSIIILKLDIYD